MLSEVKENVETSGVNGPVEETAALLKEQTECRASSESCCGSKKKESPPRFLTGKFIDSPVGKIPVISTEYTWRDMLGAWKVRWGIKRMDYRTEPGLYAIGRPDEKAPLFVSANYKLSFDRLRCSLAGIDAWILVLDTDGVNVWCAAGKGTFSTQNLMRSVARLRLNRLVAHETLIVPQLGASGVSGHEVRSRTGFQVVFGPVRASDIPAFLKSGMKATPEMRHVRFDLPDRAAVVPVDLMQAMGGTIKVLGVLFLLNILRLGDFTPGNVTPYLLSVLAGTVLVPMILPFLPFRSFALKGAVVGLVLALLSYTVFRDGVSWREATAGFLLLPSVSSWFALNFTGSTTFTSPSGVNRELKAALPLYALAVTVSAVILISEVFM